MGKSTFHFLPACRTTFSAEMMNSMPMTIAIRPFRGTEPIRVFPSQPCGDALSAQDRYREHREPDPQHSSPYFANSINPSTRHKSLDLKANKSTLMRDKRQIKIHSELLEARDGQEKVYFPKLEGTLSFDNERFWRF